MASSGQANQTLTHYPDSAGKGASFMFASDGLGLIFAFGFWLALQNALILSQLPRIQAAQQFQLQIELNVRGGGK